MALDPRTTSISNITTAKEFRVLTPSDSEELGLELKALYCLSDGDAVCEDYFNNTVTFPVVAGNLLYIRAKLLKVTGTTATMVGLFT